MGLDMHWGLLLLPVMASFIIKIPNHLTKAEQFKIQLTMLAFGLINGYFSEFEAIDALMWLSTIRFYGEFQLINNYHHDTLCWDSNLCI